MADPEFAKGEGSGVADHITSRELELITWVWGRSPQRGPGAEPLLGVSGTKLKSFLSIFI